GRLEPAAQVIADIRKVIGVLGQVHVALSYVSVLLNLKIAITLFGNFMKSSSFRPSSGAVRPRCRSRNRLPCAGADRRGQGGPSEEGRICSGGGRFDRGGGCGMRCRSLAHAVLHRGGTGRRLRLGRSLP